MFDVDQLGSVILGGIIAAVVGGAVGYLTQRHLKMKELKIERAKEVLSPLRLDIQRHMRAVEEFWCEPIETGTGEKLQQHHLFISSAPELQEPVEEFYELVEKRNALLSELASFNKDIFAKKFCEKLKLCDEANQENSILTHITGYVLEPLNRAILRSCTGFLSPSEEIIMLSAYIVGAIERDGLGPTGEESANDLLDLRKRVFDALAKEVKFAGLCGALNDDKPDWDENSKEKAYEYINEVISDVLGVISDVLEARYSNYEEKEMINGMCHIIKEMKEKGSYLLETLKKKITVMELK